MSGLHNQDAEASALGEVMRLESPHAFGVVAARVAPADWFRPAHATIWQTIVDLQAEGVPLDPTLVMDALMKSGDLARVGGAPYLHTLYAAASGPALSHHCELIADAATRRRIKMAGERMAQRAETGDVDLSELVQWSAAQVAGARDERVGVGQVTVDYEGFMGRSSDIPNPIVPGYLGEGDRVGITGVGGVGKSTFALQLLLCSAAGLPFLDYQTDDPFDPVRVTIVDCENPDWRRKQRMWPIVTGLKNMGLDPRPNLTLGGTGSSMDLLDPATALSLLRSIEHDKPRLAYIGPVYKLHNDDPDKEIVVKKILQVLEAVRDMGVAVVFEAHTTKQGEAGTAPMKPAGSNTWSWWAEYGLGMRPDPDSDEIVRRTKLERWRFDRDGSKWPTFVQASGDPALPWMKAPLLEPRFTDARGGATYEQPGRF